MHPYTRSAYPQDQVTVEHPTHRFQGNVQRVRSSSGKSVCVVDGAIKVTSVDARTRRAALHFIKQMQNSASAEAAHHRNNKWKGITASFLSIAVGTAATLCAAPVAPVAAVVFGVMSATAFTGSLVYANREGRCEAEASCDLSQAETMREEWSDPAERIASLRRQARQHGFSHLYNNSQLYRSALHPEEIKNLWFIALNQQEQQLNAGLLSPEQVFSNNLLDPNKKAYALAETLPESRARTALIEATINRFQELRQDFHAFSSAMEKQSQDLEHLLQIHSETLQSEKRLCLHPLRQMRLEAYAQAEDLKNTLLASYERELSYALDLADTHPDALEREKERTAIERRYNRDPDVIAIRAEYQRDITMIDRLYSEAETALFRRFAEEERELNTLAVHCRTVIQNQRKTGVAQFSEPLRQLFSSKTIGALQQVRSPLLDTRQRWTLEARPSFNWTPFLRNGLTYRTGMKGITDGVWNLFFGNDGLGSFSNIQRTQWNIHRPRCDFRSVFHMRHRRMRNLREGYFSRRRNAQPGVRTRTYTRPATDEARTTGKERTRTTRTTRPEQSRNARPGTR